MIFKSSDFIFFFKEFHRELIGKEGLVEDIRKKAQELLKSKSGVPGLDSLQAQLTELGNLFINERSNKKN